MHYRAEEIYIDERVYVFGTRESVFSVVCIIWTCHVDKLCISCMVSAGNFAIPYLAPCFEIHIV